MGEGRKPRGGRDLTQYNSRLMGATWMEQGHTSRVAMCWRSVCVTVLLTTLTLHSTLAQPPLIQETDGDDITEIVPLLMEASQDMSGIQKRAPYEFGIGKRFPYNSEVGKRAPYEFGIGKRFPYHSEVGKRAPYEFGIGKRAPYEFGIGKRAPY